MSEVDNLSEEMETKIQAFLLEKVVNFRSRKTLNTAWIRIRI
jgi:hypothetical protein